MKYVINGGKKLNGEIKISGAKNSAVALLPATLLCKDICTLKNVPDISDIHGQITILKELGAKVSYIDTNTIKIDTRSIKTTVIKNEEARTLRASYYFMGVLLGMYHKAEIPIPGGCDFGKRPVDYHIDGFKSLGFNCKLDNDKLVADGENIIGSKIELPVASVGATINILFASVLANGTTKIIKSAKEPHIIDICNFLNKMGANITGIGTNILTINGVGNLHGCEYTCICDQIEAGTFLALKYLTDSDFIISNLNDCDIGIIEKAINTKKNYIKTGPYPKFPTDMHPQLSALMLIKRNKFEIHETIWENRFRYVEEMRKFGADITRIDNTAKITGKKELHGADVIAPDLRAGAALVILALAINGESTISNISNIERGYENFVSKLKSLGADIRRV